MKILRVVTLASSTGKYGGPFDTASSQSRLVSGQGDFDVTLLAGHLPGDAPLPTANLYQVVTRPVRPLIKAGGFKTCMSSSVLIETFRQVRKADVVHISFAREFIPLTAALVAVALQKPMVIQPHGMLTSRTSRLHRTIDAFVRPIFKKATTVIALTDLEKGQLQSWGGTKAFPPINVCGNPVPYETDQERAPETKNAIFIARLESRKRVSDFIDASRIAHKNGWDETYEIVGPDQGDGPIAKLGMQTIPNLTYRGPVQAGDIDGLLATAGVFVLTSENEPWGNVLVAALVKGVPVVVSRSAALAGEIEDNHLGIVVPDRQPEEVAKAVHKILSGRWRESQHEEGARKFVALRFSQSSIRETLSATYTAAMSSRTGQ